VTGSIALVGSGEYLPQMLEIEKALIEDGIENGKRAIYIQIPTAAGQESNNRLEYWKNLGQQQAARLNIESKFLPIFQRADADNSEFVADIEDSALVYMSGGDPHYLAKTLIDTPVWQAIYRNWKTGGSIAGCSAGAMVLSKEVPHFRFSKQPAVAGFNVLPNIRVIPHFDKFFKWIPDSAAKLMRQVPAQTILLGIDELTALVKKSKTDFWKVFGSGSVRILRGAEEKNYAQNQILDLKIDIN
jgi:cyanophycinase